MSEDLRYPVGKFQRPTAPLADAERAAMIAAIAETPDKLRAAVAGLSDAQLDTPYRPGGWTVRQLTHHVPDSHLNAYVRFKLALTEEAPLIKTYQEAKWAELDEARSAPVDISLALVESLHRRWVLALRATPPASFARTLTHPEMGAMTLDQLVALYAWHGRHHVAHVTGLREREGW